MKHNLIMIVSGLLVFLLFDNLFMHDQLLTSNYTKAQVIRAISWGKITVQNPDNTVHEYTAPRDVRLYPQGHDVWDWKKTNTHHKPGIQIKDLEDLISKADIFILSRGMDLVLEIKQETIEYLEKHSKQVYILESRKAADLYNKLVEQGKRVAALIHTTC